MTTRKKHVRAPSFGRIRFAGNPWPKGHRIAEFRWFGRVQPDGVQMHLHLQSAAYYEEAEGKDTDHDWKSAGCWSNYHRCTMSSEKWGAGGVLVGTRERPFDIATLGKRALRVDPLPIADPESAKFNIYLLGHDAVADHRIQFTPRSRPTFGSRWDIAWRGRIALAYIGHTDYVHRFDATVPGVKFLGFDIGPKGMSRRAARKMLDVAVVSGEALELHDDLSEA